MEGKGLNNRQLKSLPLLVSSKTVQEGCKKANISAKTFYEWRKNPLFREQLEREQKAVSDKTLSKLQDSIERAFNVLISLLDSRSDTVRRLAAADILSYGLRLRELEEVEGRLMEIERIVLERKIYR